MATTRLPKTYARVAASVSPTTTRAVGAVAVTAMVASMMMGMIEMIVEAAIGHGFWSPLRYIASVFTRGSDTDPGFSLGPVIVGLGGHMMNGLILGSVFAVIAWKLVRNPGVLAMAGMAFGALVYAVMWWGVAASIDPAMQLVNAQWFFVAHLVFGMVLGLGVAAAQRLSQGTAPAAV